MERVYLTYKDRAEFFLVYIREAHPDSILFTLKDGEKKMLKILQTEKIDDRAENAKQCVDTLKMTMPTLIDRPDNQVNTAYGAWPDRLYVIGIDGKIAYQGGPGPGGFKVNEVENWLRANTKAK
ncbi:MAG: hypothetical protein FJ303_26935 [Planctomycetes bacterium]|nr:hypothetical protein [Planctomycetota bacterium]